MKLPVSSMVATLGTIGARASSDTPCAGPDWGQPWQQWRSQLVAWSQAAAAVVGHGSAWPRGTTALEITASAMRQREVVLAGGAELSRAAAVVSKVPAQVSRGVTSSPNGRRKREGAKEGHGSLRAVGRKGTILCLHIVLKETWCPP